MSPQNQNQSAGTLAEVCRASPVQAGPPRILLGSMEVVNLDSSPGPCRSFPDSSRADISTNQELMVR